MRNDYIHAPSFLLLVLINQSTCGAGVRAGSVVGQARQAGAHPARSGSVRSGRGSVVGSVRSGAGGVRIGASWCVLMNE